MDYVWNYRNEPIEDESKIKFITEFEKTLPLREISLVEFERRIKKLVTPSMGESVSVAVIIECFRDHWAFEELHRKDSLANDLMFDDMFLFTETVRRKKVVDDK